ncbi:HNH endonuclease [Vagococcus sp. BWB3-3]|uniref:HNH endonuclease n=1 Tax=Vagococcus allomyrinae TaxID=2794353 RepID=A0A940SU51_9ENTE|nr:HNH endonuclease signature motif containing protein [Vagococcus allomyrinae]MBP1040379.1 HNH endonuclease [Vagococcus allomyrinae]
MVKQPMKPCAFPLCGKLTNKLYCDVHENHRPEKKASLYGWKWRKRREAFLIRHPLCECKDCQRTGEKLIATVVDHKTPHKGNMELFWDESNWQAMTAEHHNKKTAKEDMGNWGI